MPFTHWCASNTASMGMQKLNQMFKLLDNKLAAYQTATKIKCISVKSINQMFMQKKLSNLEWKALIVKLNCRFGMEIVE